MIDQGIDVIGQHVDTPTPQIVAQERGVYGTGHHRDLREFAPKATLCSSVWTWEKFLIPELKKVEAGNWQPNPYGAFPGIKDGGTDIACCNAVVPKDVVAKVMAERAGHHRRQADLHRPDERYVGQGSARRRPDARRRGPLEDELVPARRHRAEITHAVDAFMTTSLALKGIRKSFDGVVVLDDAEFSGKAGEVHALLGENGAGKSSLMNVAAGLYAPEAGNIAINGEPVALSGPAEARACGIGMVHQHFKLVMPFTVAENILLANRHLGLSRRHQGHPRRRSKSNRTSLVSRLIPTAASIRFLSPQQQQVEIVKVLVGGAKILILDEPTAVLDRRRGGAIACHRRSGWRAPVPRSS